MVSYCRCITEDVAKAHVSKYLRTTANYPIESEISQAAEDGHITVWGRNDAYGTWHEVKKEELAASFPLRPFVPLVPPPGSEPIRRLYSELAFCKKEFDVRWMVLD